MSQINDGKAFEKLVSMIQEAYRDSPRTKIYTNHKIKDRFGKRREFDVFIVIKSNDYNFNIAIECKDYKNPVSVEKIEAFNSKCLTVSGINKKIIISSAGFQSGAVENAQLFDIELQTLSTIKKLEALVDEKDSHTGYLGLRYVLLDYNVLVRSTIFGEVKFNKKELDYQATIAMKGKDPLKPTNFIQQELNGLSVQGEMMIPILKEAYKRGVQLHEGDITITDSFFLTILEEYPVNLYLSNRVLAVARLEIKAEVTCRPKHRNSEGVEVRSHEDAIERTKKGELYSVRFDDNDQTHFYYEYPDKESKETITIALEEDKSKKLKTIINMDTKTGEIIQPNNKAD